MSERTRYVAGFMFAEYEAIRGELVAVVKKNRPAWQAGRYNGIGGHIEPGETALQAMVREFREETGLQTLQSQWTSYATLHGSKFVVEFFYAFGPVYELETTTDEEIVLVPPFGLSPQNAIPNLTWLVPMALSIEHDAASSMVIEERYSVPCPLTLPAVYLSGGIAGLTAAQCNGWRNDAEILLALPVLDPMRWERGGRSHSPNAEIVERDLRDIDDCAALLVKVDAPSWGTAMEIRYAYQLGKPIVAFGEPNVSSAWLEHHCTAFYPTLDDACAHLNALLLPTTEVGKA